MTEEFNVN